MYRPAPVPPALTLVLAALAPDDARRLHETYQFAAAAHAGQMRDEGTPFIEHPVRVAVILWSELGCRDIDTLLAALAHDILEDCEEISADVLEGVIGVDALQLVDGVTKRAVEPTLKAERDRVWKLATLSSCACISASNGPWLPRRWPSCAVRCSD
jgi:(p)ppGpp synthase/HD superfamily hydrolase